MKTEYQLIDFERRIAVMWRKGELPYLLHLCGGNEDRLIEIFGEIKKGDWILCSHRCHYHYLLAGGSEKDLEKEIREGRSMFLFSKKLNFMSSSIVAGLCGVAAGLALGLRHTKHEVWCFLGDGAEDSGHFYEAVKYVASRELPCTFVIEDNDRSVNSTKAERGADYEVLFPAYVKRYRYTPTYPHAGDGVKKLIKFKC